MGKCMKISKHLGGGKLGWRYNFRFQQIRIGGTSGGIQPAQSGSWNYEKLATLLLNYICYILLDFNSKIISCDPTISVIRLFSVVGCLVLFCRPVCFRWVSLTYDHSVVATVCWNAVTSVKNTSSCGPQKSTVIVSFLWSRVRCLLRTDHNKKVKPKSRDDLEGNSF